MQLGEDLRVADGRCKSDHCRVVDTVRAEEEPLQIRKPPRSKRRAQRDELRWVTDRGARAVPAARKDVAAAAAPPVSSYAAMWGEPDFNTADDSTDSDEEEFDVLDDPSSESSDSDFYD